MFLSFNRYISEWKEHRIKKKHRKREFFRLEILLSIITNFLSLYMDVIFYLFRKKDRQKEIEANQVKLIKKYINYIEKFNL